MLKQILGGCIIAAATVSAACAADALSEPVAANYDWSGFYAGLNGGGAWADKCWFSIDQAADEGCVSPSGGLLGGQLGYNFQNGPFVFGVEATADWANLDETRQSLTSPVFLHTDVRALYTLGLRVGYAMDNLLVYGKAGGALADDSYEEIFNGISATTADEVRAGWLIGAGAEYGITRHISVGMEYNYSDFGSKTVRFEPTGAPFTAFDESIEQKIQTVTARLNWRF